MGRLAIARKYVMDLQLGECQINIPKMISQPGAINCSQVPRELQHMEFPNQGKLENFFGVVDMMIAEYIIGVIGMMVNGEVQALPMQLEKHFFKE